MGIYKKSKLNRPRLLILDYVGVNPKCTREELCEGIDRAYSKTCVHVRGMIKDGILINHPYPLDRPLPEGYERGRLPGVLSIPLDVIFEDLD